MINMAELESRLRAAQWGADIEWAENLSPPDHPDTFAQEIIFVICNSGMRFTTARKIFDRVTEAHRMDEKASTVFGHKGKAAAIDDIWMDREELLREYLAAEDKLVWLQALPWIGPITKFHLAKNFGLQYAKPDVHMQRLADTLKTTPQALCEELAKASGYKVATVDTMLWRAAAVGILDTSTGKFFPDS